MNGRKLLARVAALAVFGAGLTGVGMVTGATPAMACDSGDNSHQFARSLPQVRYGQKGTYVLALQLDLRDHGYKLRGTGYYGGRTLAAVKDYQRKHRIRASGIVGPKTWDSLIGSKSTALTGPQMVRHLPDYQVRPGDRDPRRTWMVYEVVSRTATNYDRVAKAWDGRTYGPAMQQLVKEFQRKVGIKASGIIGPKTWLAYYRVVSATGGWGC
ncbi:MAG: peptidoglycan-binding protein [Kribbellaceae bacterium]|nr:peptidoglycan-binding protein [Kribbellaceae bacterium]